MKLSLSPIGRRYGLIPTFPDPRDFSADQLSFLAVDTLPHDKSMDPWLGPKRDQAAEGSCVYQTTAGDIDFSLRRHDLRYKDAPPDSIPIMSAQFGYRMGRKLMGTENEDSGSDGRTSCKVTQLYGLCTEKSWPYRAGDIFRDPTPEQLTEALKFKSGAYHFLYTVDDLRRCIASDYCFRLGLAIYSSFEKPGMTTYAPKTGETLLGWHEMLGKGYDDSQHGGAFSIRNSWGEDWGIKGDLWIPYDVIANPRVFSDAVIQHLGRPW